MKCLVLTKAYHPKGSTDYLSFAKYLGTFLLFFCPPFWISVRFFPFVTRGSDVQYTVVGRQSGREVRPYRTQSGEELLILQEGIRTAAHVFRQSSPPHTATNVDPVIFTSASAK